MDKSLKTEYSRIFPTFYVSPSGRSFCLFTSNQGSYSFYQVKFLRWEVTASYKFLPHKNDSKKDKHSTNDSNSASTVKSTVKYIQGNATKRYRKANVDTWKYCTMRWLTYNYTSVPYSLGARDRIASSAAHSTRSTSIVMRCAEVLVGGCPALRDGRPVPIGGCGGGHCGGDGRKALRGAPSNPGGGATDGSKCGNIRSKAF